MLCGHDFRWLFAGVAIVLSAATVLVIGAASTEEGMRRVYGGGVFCRNKKNVRFVLPRSKTSGAMTCILILGFTDNTVSMLCTIYNNVFISPLSVCISSSLSRVHILL